MKKTGYKVQTENLTYFSSANSKEEALEESKIVFEATNIEPKDPIVLEYTYVIDKPIILFDDEW